MSLKPMAVHYSMLCNPRKDGDGRTLATELRKPLDKLLTAFAIQSKMQWEEFVRITSSRYLSDGYIRVCFIMDDNSAQKLTAFIYDHQDELDIDILEAGKD